MAGGVAGTPTFRCAILAAARRATVAGKEVGWGCTFSAFGYETFALAKDGSLPAAMLYAAAQLLLGGGAVWVADRGAQGL